MKSIVNKGLRIMNLKMVSTGKENNQRKETELIVMDERLMDINMMLARVGILLYAMIFVFCITLL